MPQPPRAEAIATATGISWSAWCDLLDRASGPSLPHDRLAVLAADHIATQAGSSAAASNHEWWAQGVAIAYEQQIGRRVPGQTSRGDFQVGVSKTFAGNLDAALDAWLELIGARTSIGGVRMEGEARVSSTEKWRYWRVDLADGTRVSVDIGRKTDQKSTVGINHTRLDSTELVEEWRGVWKGILADLS
ncbi:hypothetical protein [Arthrobacter sp.]|uniref:hypothetical protein n=1 Tax=Arthrobacter sp. TaxID=1667 RepID=UPI003A9126F1